jgi:hypothetical protein
MKYAALVVVCCAVGLLAGCGNDESTTGTGGSLTPITVAGKVIGANKQPVSGVPVLIAGIPSVNTDPNGNFSIANVGRPYTITVIDAANKQAILYRGLTRSDPTLIFLGSNPGVKKVASLSGRIFPASSYPEPATRKTLVGFVSSETGRTTTATGATGLYTLSNAEWYGPSTTTGTLHALQYDYNTSTGLPTTYVGYGVRSGISLLDATSNPNGNDTMSVVGTTSMTGSVTAPAGYVISGKTVGMVLGNTAGLNLLSDNNPAASFTYAMPNITGATFRIGVIAAKASTGTTLVWKANVAGNATGVTVTVPGAPELSLPINAATNVSTSTPFSWSQYTGGVHLLIFNGGSKPSYYIVTSATSDSIPNLSSAGLGLPTSSAYSWNVYGFGPFADVDAAAGADGFLGVLTGAVGSDASYGVAATRSFTTAP